jgi:type IX secretion system PorP/SprF family membrane protein
MKQLKLILGLIFVLEGASVWAQQDPMFTQYMTNPVTINPSIAGSRKVDNLSLVFRKQWVGIEGAPTTASLSYQGAFFNNKVGLGCNLIHDIIGPVVQTGLYFDYAYHLKINEEKKQYLSLGIMGGFNYYTFDLYSLRSDVPDDDIAISGIERRFLPNFGIGLFYHTPNFFFGASMPKILRNSLSKADNTLTLEDKEERHFFAMTGIIIDITQNIKFKPSMIGRVVNGAPLSLDLTATFMFYDKVWLGAMYRVGSSWGGLVRWQINPKLHLGYSFDFANSRLKSFNNGSHEIYISYDFVSDNLIENVIRFF